MGEPLPLTRAEATGYRETSTHAQVLRFCADLVKLTPHVRCEWLGTSGRGQPMHALVVSPSGAFTPAAADRRGLLKIFVIANIHAGEVEGKEAVLMLARDLTAGGRPPAWLRRCVLVLVPNYNPDGNDRIDPRNRALDLVKLDGQIGPPGGVGTRYTGTGINLNRDYTKQEAVESKVLARAFNRWWPHVVIDCHTTDGSLHAYDLTYDTAHTAASGDPAPIILAQHLLHDVEMRLGRRGIRTFLYGNYRDQQDPTQGWETYSPLPRYGSHYRGLTGRLDVLLETYSYIPFDARVRVMYATLLELWHTAALRADEIRRCVDAAERRVVAAGADPATTGDRVGIRYGVATTGAKGRLAFQYPAFPYPDPITVWGVDRASLRRRKLGGRPTKYRCLYYGRFVPTRMVRRPFAYVVPRTLVPRLRDHGIDVRRLARPLTCEVERAIVLDIRPTESPDVGDRPREELAVYTRTELVGRRLPGGTWIVPMAQRLANVAIYLLEAESDDGFARWGLLGRALRKGAEYPVLRINAPVPLATRVR